MLCFAYTPCIIGGNADNIYILGVEKVEDISNGDSREGVVEVVRERSGRRRGRGKLIDVQSYIVCLMIETSKFTVLDIVFDRVIEICPALV